MRIYSCCSNIAATTNDGMTLQLTDVLNAFTICGFSRVTVSLVLNASDAVSNDKPVVDSADHNGETALHYAARHGYVSSIELLLDAGADPSIRNVYGLSAADLVQMQGWDGMRRLIRATGARENDITLANQAPSQGSSIFGSSREATRSSGGWLLSPDAVDVREEACESSVHDRNSRDSSSNANEFPVATELLNDLNTDGCTSVDHLDWTTFQREYRSLSRPVLVRQPASLSDGKSRGGHEWHVWNRWQRSALRGHYGSIDVRQQLLQ